MSTTIINADGDVETDDAGLPLPTRGRTAIYWLGSWVKVYATVDGNGGYLLHAGKVTKNPMSAHEAQTLLSSLNAKFEGWQ